MTIRLLVLLLLLPLCIHAQNSFYTKHWSRVYRYELKALPRSAASVVDTIYGQAKKDNDMPQILKALLYHAKFAAAQEGGARDTLIHVLQRELNTARPPLQNMLRAMLAKMYRQYFEEHRWALDNRRDSDEKIDAQNYKTWNSRMFLSMIDDLYTRALANEIALQQIDVASISDILEYYPGTKHLRPTLYDFLAHDALDFYSEAIQQCDDDDYREQENYFRIPVSAREHYTVKGEILFTMLQAYRDRAKDKTGYVVLEIERLQFLTQAEVFTSEDWLRKLKTLRDTYQQHKVVAYIDATRAGLLLAQDPRVTDMGAARREALALCEGVLKAYPQSEVAGQCQAMRQNILRRVLRVQAESFIPVKMPSRVRVEYTNIDTVSLGIFAVSEKERSLHDARRREANGQPLIHPLSKLHEESIVLRNLGDYGGHSTELLLPALPPGMYLVRVSTHAGKEDAQLAEEFIQVTNQAMIETSLPAATRYQIIDRRNGSPMAGVDIQANGQCFVTDRQGFFSWPKDSLDRTVTVVATAGNDQVVFGESRVNDIEDVNDFTARAVVFTDRSLYRPGQTVYFKGIVLQTHGTRSDVVAGQGVKVSLEDANGKDIIIRESTTNAFGAFSGEFVLPTAGLTGQFSIFVDENFSEAYYDGLDDFTPCTHHIRVEEYKRPTFEASFQPVTRSYQAYDSVTVTGAVKMFAGANITGAKVAYHVQRVPSGYTRGRGGDNVMVTGTTTTDATGNFTVRFKAWPEPTEAQDEQAVFQYTVSADITDVQGETRSASTLVQAGCRTLSLRLEAPYDVAVQDSVAAIEIHTENLQAQFTPAHGAWRLYKIIPPTAPMREQVWDEPDLPMIPEQQFRTLFPHDSYTSRLLPAPQETLVRSGTWNTARNTTISIPVDTTWQTGAYRLEATGYDAAGQRATAKHVFEVTNPDAKRVADKELLEVKLEKVTVDTVVLQIGTAAEHLAVTVDIETDRQIITTYVVQLADERKEIAIPVTQPLRDGFHIRVSSAAYNTVLSKDLEIAGLKPTPALTIRTVTFRDKLAPGTPQTWRFTIEGPDAQRAEAEVLASMYDASLDAFTPHAWTLTPPYRSPYETQNQVRDYGFRIEDFRISGNVTSAGNRQPLAFSTWDWFGLEGYGNRRYLRRIALSDKASVKPLRVRRSRDRSLKPGHVTGLVLAEDGTPLEDVLIIVKQTNTLRRTNSQGHYFIEAGKNDTLIYRGIGRTPAYIRMKRKNRVKVYLAEDDADLILLNRPTVFMMDRLKTSNKLSSISAQPKLYYLGDDENPLNEMFRALQGVSLGVDTQGTIRIRGTNTIRSMGNLPLYIVDGVPVNSFQVDASDVAIIDVLRDDDATTIYGSRGANGVVIITTKGGNAKLDNALANVPVRRNFQETAFFFPHLTTDSVGKIQFSFTMPDALTRWKLQLLAHDKQWRTATKTLQTVTQQALMATANPPRFLRSGDVIQFPVKVTNLADHAVAGEVTLQLTDPTTGKVVDAAFDNIDLRRQSFEVAAGASTNVSFKLTVPKDIEAVEYQVIALADNNSDGERNIIPVLSNRVLVTEAIPVTLRPQQVQTIPLSAWKAAGATREDRRFVIEVTANPAWYALQALPYLLEFPYECAEQTFARYYANTLATHLATRHPKIRAILETWRNNGAPPTALQKNAELKSILLEETPWARDAESDAEQHTRLALLLDSTRQYATTTQVANKLRNMQGKEGAFPWFSDGPPSRVITQHIVSAYGHLRKLQALPEQETQLLPLMRKALVYLDEQLVADYARCSTCAITHEQLQYLYLRSFFADIKPNKKTAQAIDYFLLQAARHWQTADLYAQGMTALILYRNGQSDQAREVLRSLEEHSIQNDAAGMYWPANTAGYTWYQAPVEVQALLIEAFTEIGGPTATPRVVDALRTWLLHERRATQWPTTKATTEALYALLLSGSEWLNTTSSTAIRIGEHMYVRPDTPQPEAAIGYYKATWEGTEATAALKEIAFTQHDTNPAWATVYRQYLEDADKVVATGKELTIRKEVYRVDRTPAGEKLTTVTDVTTLHVGDLLRVRLEVHASRQVEFVHVKDARAAGVEPVEVLSKRSWQGGASYYQTTKDASTNFFFDTLPTGTHVLEYDVRINHTGDFTAGMATVQSMYAPEFTGQSDGGRLRVR